MPLTPGRQVPAAAQKIDNSVFLVCGRVGEWWVGGRARNEGSQKLSKNLLRHYAKQNRHLNTISRHEIGMPMQLSEGMGDFKNLSFLIFAFHVYLLWICLFSI